MVPTRQFAASLVVAAMILGACSRDDAEPEAGPSVEEARQTLCSAGETYIGALDQYGLLFDDTITVRAATTAGDDLDEPREVALAALADLDAANDAASEAAASENGSVPPVTALTVPIEDASRDRIDDAEDDFADSLDSIRQRDALDEVVIEVSSAAFELQIAWQLLMIEIGCLDGVDESMEAFADFVAAIQTDLAVLDLYTGPIDGIYGPLTVEAVQELQADAGLPETGLLDRPTRQALAERLGDREATQVAALQGLLIGLGYWPPPADGVWSDDLGGALAALQVDLGLEPTGMVDDATLDAVRAALDGGLRHDEAPATPAPPAPAPPPTNGSTPEAPAVDDPVTLIDVLERDGRFTTLLTAISAAGLTGFFSEEGPTTLFAPTDDAFAALPSDQLDALFADPTALDQLLLGHTVEGAALLASFAAQIGGVPSAAGGTLTFVGPADGLVVDDTARVVDADIPGGNGVLHAIDAVLGATG